VAGQKVEASLWLVPQPLTTFSSETLTRSRFDVRLY
jgi:hypothetical protein